MRVRINPHLADLAGSGLVLIGFLLAAMVISAVPVLVQGLTRHGPSQSRPAAAPGFSGSGRGTS
ncbi:MAG: hypothetical protein ACXU82_11170 [Caulobacteraceae bacterium]